MNNYIRFRALMALAFVIILFSSSFPRLSNNEIPEVNMTFKAQWAYFNDLQHVTRKSHTVMVSGFKSNGTGYRIIWDIPFTYGYIQHFRSGWDEQSSHFDEVIMGNPSAGIASEPQNSGLVYFMRMRLPTRSRNTANIAAVSAYTDITNIDAYTNRYYTLDLGVEYATGLFDYLSLTGKANPTVWFEKGIKSDDNLDYEYSIDYDILVRYNFKKLELGLGLNGICFAHRDNILGEKRNHLQLKIVSGLTIVRGMQIRFDFSKPLSNELDDVLGYVIGTSLSFSY